MANLIGIEIEQMLHEAKDKLHTLQLVATERLQKYLSKKVEYEETYLRLEELWEESVSKAVKSPQFEEDWNTLGDQRDDLRLQLNDLIRKYDSKINNILSLTMGWAKQIKRIEEKLIKLEEAENGEF